jgi:23S rRNA pseudouridine1911/1915/1917 synthase
MASIAHPVLGDPIYGHSQRLLRGLPLAHQLAWFQRQALHAWSLGFVHPATGAWLECEAPLPADLQRVLAILRGGAMMSPQDEADASQQKMVHEEKRHE